MDQSVSPRFFGAKDQGERPGHLHPPWPGPQRGPRGGGEARRGPCNDASPWNMVVVMKNMLRSCLLWFSGTSNHLTAKIGSPFPPWQVPCLGPPARCPFSPLFGWEGSPTKIDKKEKMVPFF